MSAGETAIELAGGIAKGVGKAAAQAIAPRTTQAINSTKTLLKGMFPDPSEKVGPEKTKERIEAERKRASALFARKI